MKSVILFFLVVIIICVLTPIIIDKFTIKDIEPESANELYDLLQVIVCELDKSNTEYTIVGGTLLGAVRHNGLIPWDDDADLAILNKTPQEVLEILKPLEKINIISYEPLKGNIVIVKYEGSKISLDLFMMRKSENILNNEEVYQFLFPYNLQYPNEWFYEEELYPIKNYKFGPLFLKGPNNYENYLSRAYNNWKNVAMKWNHESYAREYVDTNIFIPKLPNHDFVLKKCNRTHA